MFFAAPIAFIIFYSFGTKDTSRLLPVDLGSLSTASYKEVFDATFFTTFKATLRISITATLLCLLIGLPVAYFAAFKVSEKWKAIVLAAVVVPSFTFSATAHAVAWNGLRPKFVECTPDGFQIDPDALAAAIGSISAIVPAAFSNSPSCRYS